MAFDPLSFILGQQTAKSGGSGDYSDVHFVTFMSEDGSTELYKRPVADGDDCADPVDRGLIEEPTKESTAQYNYTHVGWSATPNGALDENILKAVTADKTVYANFAAVLRYYTVNFYDGETLLKTESLAYGTMPSYVPKKDDYDFVAWVPDAVVTGDMSYTATWKEKPAFATMSWAEISAITTAGTSKDYFKVGETKEEVLTFADGKTENIEFVIAHIRDDGSLVLVLNHALKSRKAMNTTYNSTDINYFSNTAGKYLTDTVYPALSEELRAVIKPVSNVVRTKNIRLLGPENIGITFTYPIGAIALDATKYDIFVDDNSKIREQGKDSGAATSYWIDACDKWSGGSYYVFYHVDTNGVFTKYGDAYSGTTTFRGIVFAIDV